MEAASARYYVKIRPRCGVNEIATRYPNVAAFYSDSEIREKIIAGSSLQSDIELAREIYERHEEQNPILQNWKSEQSESQADRASRRQAKLNLLLKNLDLTRHGWAADAGVKWHTVNNFMDGATLRLRPSTLRCLAVALRLDPRDFPL